jgi:hypothetical protein
MSSAAAIPFITRVPAPPVGPMITYAQGTPVSGWTRFQGDNRPEWMKNLPELVRPEATPATPPPAGFVGDEAAGAPGATPWAGDFPGNAPPEMWPNANFQPGAEDPTGARDPRLWARDDNFGTTGSISLGGKGNITSRDLSEFANRYDLEYNPGSWDKFKQWFDSRSDGGALKDAGRVITDYFAQNGVFKGGQIVGALLGSLGGPAGSAIGAAVGGIVANRLLSDKAKGFVADLYNGQLDMTPSIRKSILDDLEKGTYSPVEEEGLTDLQRIAREPNIRNMPTPETSMERALSGAGPYDIPASIRMATANISPALGVSSPGMAPGYNLSNMPLLQYQQAQPHYDTSQGRGSQKVDDALRKLMDDLGVVSGDEGSKAREGKRDTGGLNIQQVFSGYAMKRGKS